MCRSFWRSQSDLPCAGELGEEAGRWGDRLCWGSLSLDLSVLAVRIFKTP